MLATEKRRKRGVAVLITAAMLATMLPVVGLGVDVGVIFVIKGRLSAAVDAAALAAGRSINLGTDLASAQTAAAAGATKFFNSNFPPGYMGTDPAKTNLQTPTLTLENDSGGNPNGILDVQVTASVAAPTYFMRILNAFVSGSNVDTVTVSATGTATRRVLVMMLVLDKSASMGNGAGSSCDAMVQASRQFITYFSPYDYVGVVKFDYTATLIYAPSNNFKDGTLDTLLAGITCGANTNTTAALELAYRNVKTTGPGGTGLKLALNTIVLFTDGVANGITATFPLRMKVDDRFGPSDTATWPVVNGSGSPNGKWPPQNMFPWPGSEPSGTNWTGHMDPTRPWPASAPATWPNPWPAAAPVPWPPTVSFAGPWPPAAKTGDPAAYGSQDCVGGSGSGKTDGGTICNLMPVTSNTVPAVSTVYGTIARVTPFDLQNNSPGGFGIGGLFKGLSTDPTPTWPAGWNGNALRQSIAYIPDTDYWGNKTRGPLYPGFPTAFFKDNWFYAVNWQCSSDPSVNPACKNLGDDWSNYTADPVQPSTPHPTLASNSNFFPSGPYQGKLRVDQNNTIAVASMNSAVGEAYTIRNDTNYKIVLNAIYLQGNASDPVDQDFIPILANVPSIPALAYQSPSAAKANPYYIATQQKGNYLATTKKSDLQSLFAQIASSLLRLSQ